LLRLYRLLLRGYRLINKDAPIWQYFDMRRLLPALVGVITFDTLYLDAAARQQQDKD
jgi:hypothetical protein